MALGLELERDDSLPLMDEPWEIVLSKYSPTPEELENRRRGIAHLKGVYSSIPWYKERGERDGDLFWERLYFAAPLRKY